MTILWLRSSIPNSKLLAKLVLEPIYVDINAKEIFGHFKNVLFISSTIDKKLFCEEMGLPSDEVEFIRAGKKSGTTSDSTSQGGT